MSNLYPKAVEFLIDISNKKDNIDLTIKALLAPRYALFPLHTIFILGHINKCHVQLHVDNLNFFLFSSSVNNFIATRHQFVNVIKPKTW